MVAMMKSAGDSGPWSFDESASLACSRRLHTQPSAELAPAAKDARGQTEHYHSQLLTVLIQTLQFWATKQGKQQSQLNTTGRIQFGFGTGLPATSKQALAALITGDCHQFAADVGLEINRQSDKGTLPLFSTPRRSIADTCTYPGTFLHVLPV